MKTKLKFIILMYLVAILFCECGEECQRKYADYDLVATTGQWKIYQANDTILLFVPRDNGISPRLVNINKTE